MGVFRKNGNWWIDFYHQGKRIRRKVGPSKKVAEMALADTIVKKAKKEFLGICESKKILFQDFATEYLQYSETNKAKDTYKRDHIIINRYLMPVWKGEYLTDISPKMVEDYKIRRFGIAQPTTINRELCTVKNMFRKAMDWEYLRDNPARTVKRFRTPQGTLRFLSKKEAGCLLDACNKTRYPYLYPAVAIALHTGMRIGEILRLRWEDVDFNEGRINVVSRKEGHTKNYESRSVPLSSFVKNVLQTLTRNLSSPYVLCRQSGQKLDEIEYPWKVALKLSGIPHARFHDLRHTFASWLVMAGVDLRSVQELLGHKRIEMTMRYAHLSPGHMRKAIETLDGHHMDTSVS